MHTQEFTHGLTDFGIAGSRGQTLVLGGQWFSSHKTERDFENLKSVVVREAGIGQAWGKLDFDKLCHDFPNLEYVDIEYEKIDNLNWISKLQNLKHLGIRCKAVKDSRLKQGKLPLLESIDITGHEVLISLINSEVQALKLWGYKGENLEQIQCSNLRTLEFVRAPNLASLNGLHQFSRLTELNIYSAPKLTDFASALLSRSLEKLFFQSCKSLSNSGVGTGESLSYLSFLDCGQLPSINWIKNLEVLEQLRIGGTVVTDGKVNFLKSIKNLEKLHIENKKKYDGDFSNAVLFNP
jgi:hypothetical protein